MCCRFIEAATKDSATKNARPMPADPRTKREILAILGSNFEYIEGWRLNNTMKHPWARLVAGTKPESVKRRGYNYTSLKESYRELICDRLTISHHC